MDSPVYMFGTQALGTQVHTLLRPKENLYFTTEHDISSAVRDVVGESYGSLFVPRVRSQSGRRGHGSIPVTVGRERRPGP